MKFKIKIIVIAFFILTVGFAVFSEAVSKEKSSPKVKKMIKYAKNLDTSKAINLYKSFDNSEKKEFYQYLENNPGSLPPIYFVLISDSVYETDKDKAVFFYNFGKVRAKEDVYMCKDTSARQQLMIYAMMAPKTVKYMQLKSSDIDYINNISYKIIDWDNKYNNRISPVWACYHGISSFSGKPELLPNKEFTKIQKDTHNELKNMAKNIKEYKEKQKK